MISSCFIVGLQTVESEYCSNDQPIITNENSVVITIKALTTMTCQMNLVNVAVLTISFVGLKRTISGAKTQLCGEIRLEIGRRMLHASPSKRRRLFFLSSRIRGTGTYFAYFRNRCLFFWRSYCRQHPHRQPKYKSQQMLLVTEVRTGRLTRM